MEYLQGRERSLALRGLAPHLDSGIESHEFSIGAKHLVWIKFGKAETSRTQMFNERLRNPQR